MNKKKEKIYSLYVHTFPNGKVYVGITSVKPQYRWGINGKHYLALNKNNIPIQPKMYYAIQKYGWKNVKHEIILQTKFKDEIEKQERHFITEIYHSDQDEFGYNIEKGGKYSGYISKSTCELKQKIFSGKNNPAYGKHWWNNGDIQILSAEQPADNFVLGGLPRSDEYKKYMSDLLKTKITTQGKHWYNNGIINVLANECPNGFKPGMLPMSNEIVKANAEKHKGKSFWNNGIKTILANECPGDGWVKGIFLTPEQHQKRSLISKNKTVSEETKEKLKTYCGNLSSAYGKKWYNNGIEEKLVIECPGEGWVKGRLHFSENTLEKFKKRALNKNNPAYGKHWWTNGTEQLLSKECPGEGWILGMSKDHCQKISMKAKNKFWWNNELKEILSKECPGEGWKLGRLKNN